MRSGPSARELRAAGVMPPSSHPPLGANPRIYTLGPRDFCARDRRYFPRTRCAISEHALQTPELLLDRDAELETITSLGKKVAGGHGRALLVEGPAGIGKTALMHAGRQVAKELRLRALTARGVELERAFGFGVVRRLFERTIDGPRRTSGSLAASERHGRSGWPSVPLV
jgi:hypothetical protein